MMISHVVDPLLPKFIRAFDPIDDFVLIEEITLLHFIDGVGSGPELVLLYLDEFILLFNQSFVQPQMVPQSKAKDKQK